MENVQNINLILDIDIDRESEEDIASAFSKAIEEKGFKLSDNTVSLRNNRLSSIRAVDTASGEEVEMYAFSRSVNGKTIISLKII
ncbi:MAG TPA: hypothetical protein DEP48_09870 [Persephonella sp.]|uniref:Uncharacterized protein n=1 Tax=Persephonella marina (strain DSM 14350 / EX-H1) TaxID=123214 RepID=C0QSR2_PERMH|nr:MULTISPECIES: hypothetical protein [Persephonella]ACO03683.1 hypothetical protein PERMA_1955 [Persephonella marina EX-H1]HCB70654.1 hypothetical protein [Persephonella sp.]